jgi:hypothetical protein
VGGSSRRPDGATTTDAQLAATIARGVRAGGHEDLADELARSYLAKAAEASKREADPLDPLHRHPSPDGIECDRIEGERGGPTVPAGGVFAGVLESVPRIEPGTLPSPEAEASRSLRGALERPQAGYRPRGGGRRKKRDERRARRRAHDKERLARVREEMFAKYGQVADVPELPALLPEVYGMNLAAMRDGTGRKACELVSKLPLGQQMAIYTVAHGALAQVRAGKPSSFGRVDLARAALPETRDELAKALEAIKAEVAPTTWFRRIACAAWGSWGHRGKPLTKEARQAARGGVYLVEGFCQNALSWLVPRPDGTPWSRSVLWGPNGPFALLGAAARQLGRKVEGEPGAGLWTRWQPAAGAARFKGPTRKNPKTGETERFAVGQARYDEPMAGRTAASLARRARGALRELARTVVSVMTPWVELPERKRVPSRPEGVEAPSPEAEARHVDCGARAPP